MSKFSLSAIALAAALFAAQPAMAVPFDPQVSSTFHVDVDETTDAATIDILGYSFAGSALGTVFMNEEPPFTTFGSDSITVSNTGANGRGQIILVSSDMPRATTTCNNVPDESVSPYCYLSLQLVAGPLLQVTVYSPAGDTANPNLSDSIDIRVVPEPASLALLALGLAGLGFSRRKKV